MVAVSDVKFGAVPKTCIRTPIDRMVCPKLQEETVGNWPVEQGHALPSGHFPPLSMPGKPAEMMLWRLAENFRRLPA